MSNWVSSEVFDFVAVFISEDIFHFGTGSEIKSVLRKKNCEQN